MASYHRYFLNQQIHNMIVRTSSIQCSSKLNIETKSTTHFISWSYLACLTLVHIPVNKTEYRNFTHETKSKILNKLEIGLCETNCNIVGKISLSCLFHKTPRNSATIPFPFFLVLYWFTSTIRLSLLILGWDIVRYNLLQVNIMINYFVIEPCEDYTCNNVVSTLDTLTISA